MVLASGSGGSERVLFGGNGLRRSLGMRTREKKVTGKTKLLHNFLFNFIFILKFLCLKCRLIAFPVAQCEWACATR